MMQLWKIKKLQDLMAHIYALSRGIHLLLHSIYGACQMVRAGILTPIITRVYLFILSFEPRKYPLSL